MATTEERNNVTSASHQTKFLMTGYIGRPYLLTWIEEQPDLILVDIRYSPRSRNAAWLEQSLVNLIGDRYLHLPDFGNINYQSKDPRDIKLCNPERGLAALRKITAPRALLVCACHAPVFCHRRHVQAFLEGQGVTVTELLETDLW